MSKINKWGKPGKNRYDNLRVEMFGADELTALPGALHVKSLATGTVLYLHNAMMYCAMLGNLGYLSLAAQ